MCEDQDTMCENQDTTCGDQDNMCQNQDTKCENQDSMCEDQDSHGVRIRTPRLKLMTVSKNNSMPQLHQYLVGTAL